MFNPINDWYLKIHWKIVGQENIDRTKCYVVVCNHQSALDAIGAGKVKTYFYKKPSKNIFCLLGWKINMVSVQFSKNRLNPDMGHGGLFKFMGAS